jgi:Flp pilus assembly protein CpaB
VILLAAVGLGLVSAFFLFQYIDGIEDDVRADIEPVPVFKATETIPQGTTGEDAVNAGWVELGEIAQEFQPEGPILNADAISGQVAVFDIPRGLPISRDMFVEPSAAEVSFQRRLSNPNWVTVTVSVDEVRGVSGFLIPGDEVNIMVGDDLGRFDDDVLDFLAAEAGLGGEEIFFVPPTFHQHLYHKVHVLAVGRITQRLPGEAAPEGDAASPDVIGNTGLITFNVPPEAAQNIATWGPSVYLSLVPENYEPSQIDRPPIVWAADDFPAQSSELTPYGPDGDGRGE